MRNYRILGLVILAGLCIKIASAEELPVIKGPFKPTDESLQNYRYPEWFRNAKFGTWAHWGPQVAPRRGDCYAKKIYQEGSKDYKDHLERFSAPSKSGYKDIIPLSKAEKWDPEKLMALYKKAVAKYFVSIGSHHDNFFLWKSKIHRWNSVEIGPHKDVVGLWQKQAKAQVLYFGISEHLAASYTWFQSAQLADTLGQYKSVPYDGNYPRYIDLYHNKAAPCDKSWLTTNPEWMKEWYGDVKELVDIYQPDLLYSDSKLPFDEVGRVMLANYYYGNLAFNKGKSTAVYNCKEPSGGKWMQDLERGVQDSISPFLWQTYTSIGDWFYSTGQKYKPLTDILRMLTHIVSKNGNLLINIVQTPEGEVETDLIKTLEEIGRWTAANGEGIYGRRPWVIFGERPATAVQVKAGNFNDKKIKYSADDIRFTTKGNALYAFSLGLPADAVKIKSREKNMFTTIKKSNQYSCWDAKRNYTGNWMQMG